VLAFAWELVAKKIKDISLAVLVVVCHWQTTTQWMTGAEKGYPCGPEQVCMPQSLPDRRRVEYLALNTVSTCFADVPEALSAG
jgi:hypothetical protein